MGVKGLLQDLNPAQKKAVTYQEGPLLILAGAGSGKTRVLTRRAAWLTTEGKLKPNQLLLLTFTNKAAEEMKRRVFLLLSSGQKKEKLKGLFAGTFHSFAVLVLRRHGPKVGIDSSFLILDEKDQQSLLKEIIKEEGLGERDFTPSSLQKVIDKAKSELIDPSTFSQTAVSFWQEKVAQVYREYQLRLRKMKALDFTDLLYWAVKLFQEKKEVLAFYQERYRHLLVDEYQDTNHLQYLLTKDLAKAHRQLTVVGDAAQSIYSWRGADYRNLFYLQRDFPEIKVVHLDLNYRSSQIILNAAYEVISENTSHPVLRLKAQNGLGEKIGVYQADSEIDEAEFVAEKVKWLADFEKIPLAQMAVLYRTNAQSRVIEEVFIRRGLPYLLLGGVRFYDRAEVKDVVSLLRVFYQPADSLSWQRIERNMGKRRMAVVREFVNQNKGEKWSTVEILKKVLEATGYLAKFDPQEEEGRRRLENIQELVSVAEEFPSLKDFLENITLVQQEYSAQEKEKKEYLDQAVRLMTLHASKGLEFEVVFLVGLEEGLLPHVQSLEDEKRLEEERRLCYVGMTRARRKLFLTFTRGRFYFGRRSFNEPSRFLSQIRKEWLEFLGSDDLQEDQW